MEMMEAFSSAFGEALKLAVVLLTFGLIITALIGRFIEGEMSIGEALVLALLPFATLMLMLRFWGSVLGVLLGCTLLFGIVVWWALKRVSASQMRRYLDEQEIARYKATIERDPRNAGAHSYLGDVYLRMKRYDDAIREFEIALELDPTSRSDRYKLKKAREAKQQAEAHGIVCPRCRKINPRTVGKCIQCGWELPRPLALDFALWLSQPDSLRRVLKTAAWILPILILIGVISSLLPFPFNRVFWLVLFCAFIVWIWRSLA